MKGGLFHLPTDVRRARSPLSHSPHPPPPFPHTRPHSQHSIPLHPSRRRRRPHPGSPSQATLFRAPSARPAHVPPSSLPSTPTLTVLPPRGRRRPTPHFVHRVGVQALPPKRGHGGGGPTDDKLRRADVPAPVVAGGRLRPVGAGGRGGLFCFLLEHGLCVGVGGRRERPPRIEQEKVRECRINKNSTTRRTNEKNALPFPRYARPSRRRPGGCPARPAARVLGPGRGGGPVHAGAGRRGAAVQVRVCVIGRMGWRLAANSRPCILQLMLAH